MRILHISDLHIGRLPDEYDERKVLKTFIRTMRTKFAEGGPDLIAFTGDLAFSGESEQYIRAGVFLEELLEACGCTKEVLLLVPGNHDVAREAGLMLKRTLKSAQEADAGFFAKPGMRVSHLSKFAAFCEFHQRFLPDRPLADTDAVFEPIVIDVLGTRVGVAGFNSAWFAKNDSDQGRLWLGPRVVRERASALHDLGADFTIALLHHPFSWLHEADPSGAWVQEQFDLVLRGHLHKAGSRNLAAGSTAVTEVVAGALYQGSDRPCRAFILDIDLAKRTMTLEPLTFVDHPNAHEWVVDATVYPDQEHNKYFGSVSLVRPKKDADLAITASAESPVVEFGSVRWLPDLADWFKATYPVEPDAAMSDILRRAKRLFELSEKQPNFRQHLANLGKAIAASLPSGSDPVVEHHRTVLEVLSLDPCDPVSHLFMIPRLDLPALFSSPDYANLILSVRLLGRGRFDDAERRARSVGPDCCVAGFVIGQSLRKRERIPEADVFFEMVESQLQATASDDRLCNANPGGCCLCRQDLLEAELLRARAVVSRRRGERKAAEDYFLRAQRIADRLLEAGEASSEIDEAELEVAADIFYSEGYFFFEQDKFDEAVELFRKSELAISMTHVTWNAPTTRRGLALLLLGQRALATSLLIRARELCLRSLTANKESGLSSSLCALGLLVAAEQDGTAPVGSPIKELLEVLRAPQGPGDGAIQCHLTDARKLTQVAGDGATTVIAEYVAVLEGALSS